MSTAVKVCPNQSKSMVKSVLPEFSQQPTNSAFTAGQIQAKKVQEKPVKLSQMREILQSNPAVNPEVNASQIAQITSVFVPVNSVSINQNFPCQSMSNHEVKLSQTEVKPSS